MAACRIDGGLPHLSLPWGTRQSRTTPAAGLPSERTCGRARGGSLDRDAAAWRYDVPQARSAAVREGDARRDDPLGLELLDGGAVEAPGDKGNQAVGLLRIAAVTLADPAEVPVRAQPRARPAGIPAARLLERAGTWPLVPRDRQPPVDPLLHLVRDGHGQGAAHAPGGHSRGDAGRRARRRPCGPPSRCLPSASELARSARDTQAAGCLRRISPACRKSTQWRSAR